MSKAGHHGRLPGKPPLAMAVGAWACCVQTLFSRVCGGNRLVSRAGPARTASIPAVCLCAFVHLFCFVLVWFFFCLFERCGFRKPPNFFLGVASQSRWQFPSLCLSNTSALVLMFALHLATVGQFPVFSPSRSLPAAPSVLRRPGRPPGCLPEAAGAVCAAHPTVLAIDSACVDVMA